LCSVRFFALLKFLVTEEIADRETASVLTVLATGWIHSFDAPDEVESDQDGALSSHEARKFASLWGIHLQLLPKKAKAWVVERYIDTFK